jgi:Domain of unknown function (DUF543)
MPASELKVADKWDFAIETGIKRTVYGTVAAGVVAVLLFRAYTPHVRYLPDVYSLSPSLFLWTGIGGVLFDFLQAH